MAKESFPLQHDMFTGELVDNRSRHQKRLENQAQQPHQMLMFKIGEMMPLGASVRPWLKDLPRPQLELVSEDPRTPEEVELDLLRAAATLTSPMFGSEPALAPPPVHQLTRVVIPVHCEDETQPACPLLQPVIGYRARARSGHVRFRARNMNRL
jgi:hypothetical protein